MKNVLRIILVATLALMVSHVASANNGNDKTKPKANAKTSKVYVVLKSGNTTSQFMDKYGSEIKNRFAQEGIEAEYAVLSGKFPNAVYTIAQNKGADHIIYINQTTQLFIDGKTNVGGYYEVKAFNLTAEYQWKDIDNIKMNVQFDKSIKEANDRIIESFLNKI